MTNPAVAILTREREALWTSILEHEAKARSGRAALRQIDDAIAKLGDQLSGPAAQAGSRSTGSKLKDVVQEVIEARPQGSTTSDILAGLNDRGRPTDTNSLLSTLSRLKAAGVIYKSPNKLWKPGAEPGGQSDLTNLDFEIPD